MDRRMGRLSSSCRLNRFFSYLNTQYGLLLQTLLNNVSRTLPIQQSRTIYSSTFFTAFPALFFLEPVFFARFFFTVFLFAVFFSVSAVSPSISEAVVTFFRRPTRLGAALVHSGSEQKYFILPLPSVRSSNCLPQTGQGLSVGLSQEVKSHSG